MSPAHRIVEAIPRDFTKPSRYAWIIDTDHLFDGDPKFGGDEAGTMGPGNAPQELQDRLLNDEAGVAFRMYDGDGELYYTGRIIALNDDGTEQTFDTCGEEFFGPLKDYGEGNAGCTAIKYMHRGNWTEL